MISIASKFAADPDSSDSRSRRMAEIESDDPFAIPPNIGWYVIGSPNAAFMPMFRSPSRFENPAMGQGVTVAGVTNSVPAAET